MAINIHKHQNFDLNLNFVDIILWIMIWPVVCTKPTPWWSGPTHIIWLNLNRMFLVLIFHDTISLFIIIKYYEYKSYYLNIQNKRV